MLAVVVALLALPAAARGQDDVESGASFEGCAPDTAARMRFIEGRLEDGQNYARYWWYGWTGFYAASMVVASARAGTEDDSGERADQIVNAVKALTGTVRNLIQRPTARLGADPVLGMPVGSEVDCQQRLGRGEELLRESAEEARERYSIPLHVGIVLFNVAGGVIVAQGFDEPDGWRSAGIGIVVGEIAHWSHPWRQASDLEEYERRFPPDGVPRPAPVSWGIAPIAGGAALRVSF
jgi:hypothetical protein